jgi:hypothetical protein
MFCFSEEAVGDGIEVQVRSPSVSSAAKKNPPNKPASKAPMAKAQNYAGDKSQAP